jgi:hypothetical protein
LDDSPGMIRPITLNVVGHVQSQGRAAAPSLDAGQLVRHYIEQSVEQPAIREIAPSVLKELVTEQGTKRPRSEKDLVEQTRLRLGEVRAVMNGLSAAALARPLDAAQGVWELSHDFVARGVARYLGRRRFDWPGLARAFAAPALFGLMAAAVAGAFLWNAGTEDRLRAELANVGIDISSDGLEAASSTRFRPEAVQLLGKVRTLQSLDLFFARVEDLTPLKDLTALRFLNVDGTQVAHLKGLEALTALQSLSLQNALVDDLSPLNGLTALQSLELFNTPVADLAPLKGLTALQLLDLGGTRVTDVAPLKGLTALRRLNLGGTKVSDVAPLKDLNALQYLGLSQTNVTDLAPLKGLSALQSLDLENTRVANLVALQDLPNLVAVKGATNSELQELNAFRSQKGLAAINSQ